MKGKKSDFCSDNSMSFILRHQRWQLKDPWKCRLGRRWQECTVFELSPRLRYACGEGGHGYGTGRYGFHAPRRLCSNGSRRGRLQNGLNQWLIKWFVLTFSSHGLTGKGADGVNGLWCTVLETDAMDALKETWSVKFESISQFLKNRERFALWSLMFTIVLLYFVQVDGVLAGYDILDSGTGLSIGTGHFALLIQFTV